MRYTGPKDRLSRREGIDLFGKGAKLTRLNVPPGMHGHKGTRKISDYRRQLREKQKAKRIYGVTEKQFKAYVNHSQKSKNLLELLEKRLDNVVYRLGFAPTRPAARQLVSHRHILVDSKAVNIPSYQVKPDQTIALDPKAQHIPEIKRLIEEDDIKTPNWLKRKAVIGKITRLPSKEDVIEPISEQEIIEYYSR